MLPRINELKGKTLDVFFPKWCVGCGKEGSLLCSSCYHSLPRINPPLCPKCGRPQSSVILCPGCVGWQSAIDGIRSLFRFDGIGRESIHQFKYNNLRPLSSFLTGLMYESLINNPIPGKVIAPVPLYSRRLKDGGYNQSSLLARQLSELTGLTLLKHSLKRIKSTPPQISTKTVAERQNNVADAFYCEDYKLNNKQVLLIDDVCTSGATLNACATALKNTGATSVWGLTLARKVYVISL